MKKNIWMLHHYATPPSMSGLTRPYDFSKQLKKHGYKSTIFASAYLHYTGENLIPDRHRYIEYLYDGIPFVFIRSPEYKNNDVSRMLNMVTFSYNLFPAIKTVLKKKRKTRYNICVIPSSFNINIWNYIRKEVKGSLYL